MYRPSIYSKLYVRGSRRAKFTPRVGRPWRPRMIAWHGPDAFFRNRFYEVDSWYKARIQRPELLPELHIIDPDLFVESLEQRMIRPKERSLDIGFKQREEGKEQQQFAKTPTAEQRAQLEQLAIRNQLFIDLERVDSTDLLSLVDHFNVFEDLFLPGTFFHSVQPMDIKWPADASSSSSSSSAEQAQEEQDAIADGAVLFGNVVKARAATQAPQVRIGGGGGAYSTLLMLNLEGVGQSAEAEDQQQQETTESNGADEQGGGGEQQMLQHLERCQLLHWLVANIPDSGTETTTKTAAMAADGGEQLVPYLQPVPFLGTGYHRFVFLLFRHRQPLDLAAHALKGPDSLLARRFNTNAFYKQFEGQMTPSALRFCQIKWDGSCDRALHQMGMKSPRYWYQWNEVLRPEQKEFPLKRMPFDHYLDMFRNPETVRREVQAERLERLVKLKPGERLEPQRYPDIFYQQNYWRLPHFQHRRRMQQDAGQGVWASMYQDYENPAEQHEMPKYAEEEEKMEEPLETEEERQARMEEAERKLREEEEKRAKKEARKKARKDARKGRAPATTTAEAEEGGEKKTD